MEEKRKYQLINTVTGLVMVREGSYEKCESLRQFLNISVWKIELLPPKK